MLAHIIPAGILLGRSADYHEGQERESYVINKCPNYEHSVRISKQFGTKTVRASSHFVFVYND